MNNIKHWWRTKILRRPDILSDFTQLMILDPFTYLIATKYRPLRTRHIKKMLKEYDEIRKDLKKIISIKPKVIEELYFKDLPIYHIGVDKAKEDKDVRK